MSTGDGLGETGLGERDGAGETLLQGVSLPENWFNFAHR